MGIANPVSEKFLGALKSRFDLVLQLRRLSEINGQCVRNLNVFLVGLLIRHQERIVIVKIYLLNAIKLASWDCPQSLPSSAGERVRRRLVPFTARKRAYFSEGHLRTEGDPDIYI